MKYFVVSDIHGMANQFERILEKWNPKEEELVLLGDYVDRGEESKEVLEKILELKKEYGSQLTVLLGNHDLIFMDFIENPEGNGEFYYHVGGRETVVSLLKPYAENILYDTHAYAAFLIEEHYEEVLMFLKEGAKLFWETEGLLFTHAGYQTLFENYQNSKESDFTNIRNHYKHKNETGLVNVFGHTTTNLMNEDGNFNPWVKKDGTFIGIDGGCCFGGQLNAVVLNGEGKIIKKYVEK